MTAKVLSSCRFASWVARPTTRTTDTRWHGKHVASVRRSKTVVLSQAESKKVDIPAAEKRIRPYVRETRLVLHQQLSSDSGADVYLKCDFEQDTGSFKIRGCTNFMLKRLNNGQNDLKSGFVAASSGCHALALLKTAKNLSIEGGQIFVPKHINLCKEKILNDWGANLRKVADVDQAEVKGRQTAVEKGVPFISAYNDVDVISGQGTVGLEIQRQLPHIDAVFCPVGGGGLISGVATALKDYNKHITIVGCEVASSRALSTAVLTGNFIEVPEQRTLATSLLGGIEKDSITVEICKKTVDEWIAVTEDEIERAIYNVYKYFNKRIEGGAATSLAGYMKNSARFRGKKVVCILSGCHLDDHDLAAIIAKYEGKRRKQ